MTGIGYVRAQSQDATNARFDERMNESGRRHDAMDKRIDRIEGLVVYVMLGLSANLVAHLLQIRTQVRGRKRDEDDS